MRLSQTTRLYVGIWLTVAIFMGALLGFAEYRRNPLNDPDQAWQRTGVLLPAQTYQAPTVGVEPRLSGHHKKRVYLLAEGGPLNWTIWNGIRCGGEPCHVPPMLFIIYLVWRVFFFLAARKPLAYVSFLNFTMWANLFHGLLMAVQAAMEMDRYWSKWFTDIPFVLILALGIYLWRPTPSQDGIVRERALGGFTG